MKRVRSRRAMQPSGPVVPSYGRAALLAWSSRSSRGWAARPRARPRSGGDPLALVGWWRVATTGETVVIDPARFEVRTDVRTTEGSWVGDSAGRVPGAMARAVLARGRRRVRPRRNGSPRPPGSPWTDRPRAARPGGRDRVARLVPAPAGTVTGAADPARPPSDQERRAGRPSAPLPPGRTPVGDPTGRWVPTEDVGVAPGLRRLRRRRHVDRLGRLHRHRRLVARGPRRGLPGHRAVAHDVRGLSRRGRGAAGRCGAHGSAPTGRPSSLLDADGAPVGHFRRLTLRSRAEIVCSIRRLSRARSIG